MIIFYFQRLVFVKIKNNYSNELENIFKYNFIETNNDIYTNFKQIIKAII